MPQRDPERLRPASVRSRWLFPATGRRRAGRGGRSPCRQLLRAPFALRRSTWPCLTARQDGEDTQQLEDLPASPRPQGAPASPAQGRVSGTLSDPTHNACSGEKGFRDDCFILGSSPRDMRAGLTYRTEPTTFFSLLSSPNASSGAVRGPWVS